MASTRVVLVLVALAVVAPVLAEYHVARSWYSHEGLSSPAEDVTTKLRKGSLKSLYLTSAVDFDDSSAREVEELCSLFSGALRGGQLFSAIVNAAVATGADERILRQAVAVSAQWGTLESLDRVREYFQEGGKVVVHDGGRATLADILQYLYVEKCKYTGESKWIWTLDGEYQGYMTSGAYLENDGCGDSKCVLLGDDVMVRIMDYDGSPLERTPVVVPYGWLGGLTVFSQMNYKNVIMDLGKRVRDAQLTLGIPAFLEGGDLEADLIDRVVDEAIMSHPLVKVLQSRAPSVEWIGRIKASELEASDEAIALMMRPKVDGEGLVRASKMAEGCYYYPSELEDTVLRQGPLGKGDYIRYLLESATMVTMPVLGQLASKMYSAMMDKASLSAPAAGASGAAAQAAASSASGTAAGAGSDAEAGVGVGDVASGEAERIPVIYCTMERKKSSNIVYHTLFMTTPADPRDHHYCMKTRMAPGEPAPAFVEKLREGATAFLVDDLSISGEQQSVFAQTLQLLLEHFEVRASPIVVPLLYTDKAKKKFENEGIPAVYGSLIRDAGVGSWMLKSGFNRGLYNIALSWMVPDNCNTFFSEYVGPSFTFHGCGVKGRMPHHYHAVPPCRRLKRKAKRNQEIAECLPARVDAHVNGWEERIAHCYGSNLAGDG